MGWWSAYCRMSKKYLLLSFKDLGRLRSFLGIDFQQSAHCVKMSQENYVEKILDKFDMQDCKPRVTPWEPKFNYTNNAEVMSIVRKYREAVGSFNVYQTRSELSSEETFTISFWAKIRAMDYCKTCTQILKVHKGKTVMLQKEWR